MRDHRAEQSEDMLRDACLSALDYRGGNADTHSGLRKRTRLSQRGLLLHAVDSKAHMWPPKPFTPGIRFDRASVGTKGFAAVIIQHVLSMEK